VEEKTMKDWVYYLPSILFAVFSLFPYAIDGGEVQPTQIRRQIVQSAPKMDPAATAMNDAAPLTVERAN
jgi:hypothetical protein